MEELYIVAVLDKLSLLLFEYLLILVVLFFELSLALLQSLPLGLSILFHGLCHRILLARVFVHPQEADIVLFATCFAFALVVIVRLLLCL